MTETAFADKVEILADLWMNYRDDEDYEDFMAYADLGLPLAYAKNENMIELSPKAEDMINEAFDMLLSNLGVEDEGYASLDQLLGLEDYEIPIVYLNEDEESDEEDFLVSENEQLQDEYDIGYIAGAQAEQKRVQEVVAMHKRWAKENKKGNEFMFWDSVGEVLTPIEIDYSEEAYRKSLEADGF